MVTEIEQKPPKIFISYSHDDENHKNWVKELAVELRKNDIDVILDQFTPLGTDLPLFMEQGLSESHKVLCICSNLYNEKANAGIAGVNYEKRIICQELMRESASAWVIPIIRNNTSEMKLPNFLSSLKYISFEDDECFPNKYYELLKELHNRQTVPPLGPNPFEHDDGVIGKINEMNQIVKTIFSIASYDGTVRFNFLSNSGNFIIGSDECEFNTHWSSSGHDSIHAYRDYVYVIATTSHDVNFDQFSISDYDFSTRARTASIGDSIIWVNGNGKILVTKIEKIEYENNQKYWIEKSYRICTMLEPIDLTEIKENI
jgi:hypothetical protein